MYSQREIKRRYAKMLKGKSHLDIGNVNCYICDKCDHITKTIDIDDGVTPFLHRCEKCGEFAESTFYNDVIPDKKPTQEWYRPTLEQCMKLRKKDESLLEHVLNGGLVSRLITRKED